MPNTRTTKAAFEVFDQVLNLDPAERDAAIARHHDITDCLIASGVAESTFLQGSFARKTMPKPLKDVDMIILLPAAMMTTLRRPGGPAAAFEALKAPLLARFPGVAFDATSHAAHALQLTFPDLGFTFDLVPAFADPAGGEDVFIADRELDNWERSNTRQLKRVVAERNLITGGLLVHQVRMLKAFNKNQLSLDVCGLVMESIGCAAIRARLSHAAALTAALEWAAANVQARILDPTEVEDLAAEWSPAQRAAYAQIFASAARRGREALGLEADSEHDAATEIWGRLLGDDFPVPEPQSYAQALTSLSGGSITTTGRAVPSQRGNQLVRPGRSWRSH